MTEHLRPTNSNPTPEELDQIENLVDQGVGNRIEARIRVLGETAVDTAPVNIPKVEPAPRKPRTSEEKAWADRRPDLKPFPYGTKPEN